MRLWAWVRCGVAGVVLVVLVARLGAEPFLRALEQITIASLVAALVLTAATTLCVAWRWAWVARRLGLSLGLGTAWLAYYRSQLLNQVLPGGVLGDVDRALRHGDDQAAEVGPSLGRAARAVAWERALGQVGLLVVVLAAAAWLPPSLRAVVAWSVVGLVGLPVLVALGLPWISRSVRRVLGADLRRLVAGEGLWLALGLSMAAAAGHLLVMVVALRLTGVEASTTQALPLLLLVLLASSLPLSLAGWGPREGAAAAVFATAGLGAANGVTLAATYGILSLVAAAPGAVLLLRDFLLSRVRVTTG